MDLGGIYRGIVENNSDPQGLHRLTAVVPVLWGNNVSTSWAWPCVPPHWLSVADFTGQNPMPYCGEPVWIMFEAGDREKPVWLGVGTFT